MIAEAPYPELHLCIKEEGVEVDIVAGKGHLKKRMSLETLTQVFQNSNIETPLLPPSCIYFNNTSGFQYLIMVKPAHKRELLWGKDTTEQRPKKIKNVPIPNLVSFISLYDTPRGREGGLLQTIKIFSTKVIPTSWDERLYFFPYGNIDGSGHICLGGNNLPKITTPRMAGMALEMVLNSPFNQDVYSAAEYNITNLPGKEFPESAYYATNYTLKSFLTHLKQTNEH